MGNNVVTYQNVFVLFELHIVLPAVCTVRSGDIC